MIRKKYEEAKERFKLQAVKEHLVKHRTAYLCGGAGIAVGIFVGRRTSFVTELAPQIVNTVAPVFNNNNSSNVNFGGHLRKLVRDDQTGQIWETVTDAAEALGIEFSRLSRHLNRHIPDINGKTYSIVGIATG